MPAIMNYSKLNGMNVLADPTLGELRLCKRCGTVANLDEGLCEACFMESKQ